MTETGTNNGKIGFSELNSFQSGKCIERLLIVQVTAHRVDRICRKDDDSALIQYVDNLFDEAFIGVFRIDFNKHALNFAQKYALFLHEELAINRIVVAVLLILNPKFLGTNERGVENVIDATGGNLSGVGTSCSERGIPKSICKISVE